MRSEAALKARFVRAVLEYLDFKPFKDLFTRGALAAARVRAVLPDSVDRLAADRTSREVVVLNLFVARQESVPLAAHARNSFLPTDYIDLNPDLVV